MPTISTEIFSKRQQSILLLHLLHLISNHSLGGAIKPLYELFYHHQHSISNIGMDLVKHLTGL